MATRMIPAIVLAGGLGTRLRSVVRDVPKVLAPVGGRPFLEHLLVRLASAGCPRVVLAVSYLREQVVERFGHDFQGMEILYSAEEAPLGTGGAIRQALGLISTPQALVVNGDTWIDLDYRAMLEAHLAAKAQLTVAIAEVDNVARYGAVEVTPSGRILRFAEKGERRSGSINGGVYVIDKSLFEQFDSLRVFSFEADFLAPKCAEIKPLAFRSGGRFIDIGVPEDYSRALAMIGTMRDEK
ncbi:MAG: nucleotidyltransferase family protein [Betaproteobacteria bacterium]